MKDKGTLFFVTIMCIILCGISFVSMVYAFRLAKIADEKNVIYKDIATYVEYSNGRDVELNGSKKGNYVIKDVIIKNQGADPVYVDFLWDSIDMQDPNMENPFYYSIEGKSMTGESTLSKELGQMPLDTTITLLSGELIEPGDVATYTIKLEYTGKKANESSVLYTSFSVKVRH